MSQQGSQGWIWDEQQRFYYYYDHPHDQIVLQDGRRFPRPASMPRTMFQSAATQAQPSESQFVQSPLEPAANYAYGAPDSQQARQPPSQMNELNSAFGRVSVGAPVLPRAQPQIPQPAPTQGQVYERDGVRMVSAVDTRTGVQITFGTQPVESITDPALLRAGVRAHRRLYGHANGTEERLYSTFKIRERPRRFFVQGRVFLVLWTEPAGESATTITSLEANDRSISRPNPGMTVGRFGERIYSKVRRFVVVREGANYCSALPIVSYGGRGVAKSGVMKHEHAIIHTGAQAPAVLESELPKRGEHGMRARAIRVVPDEPTDKLDAASRIDFAKVHTIQHNIKVKPFGNVHQHSMDALITQFGNVWGHAPGSSIVAASSSGNNQSSAGRAGLSGSGAAQSDDSADSDSESGASDDDDDDEQGETPQSSPVSPRNQRPQANPASPSVPAVNPHAQQAQRVRAQIASLVQQGRSPEEAFEVLVQQLVSHNYTREGATGLLRARLTYGLNTVPQASNTTEGDGDEESDGDEEGSDSDGSEDDDTTAGH